MSRIRTLAATSLCCLCLGAGGALAADDSADAKTPPPAVVVAAVQTQDVAAAQRYIGTVKAIQSVDLRARVEGFLEKVAFEQGSNVAQGQLLYQIEQASYQADLEKAKGQLAAAEAQLASAQATLEDREADFQRQATLVKKGDVSQTMFDRAKAQRDEARAAVESAKASEQQARAAIDSAKISLSYTTIHSPIDGRIGATNSTEGNLVGPNSGTLATVVQLDPIRAVFSIPSADFVRLQQRAAKQSGGDPREIYQPRLILPTGETYAHAGKVAFADNRVDTGTGTIPIYADFPNPERVLLPGQFVTALVSTAEKKRAPVVPAAAIQRTRQGEQVYVVGDGHRIEQRTIETGVEVGNGYAVTSGLQDGEVVVVSGVQKVKPGMVVKPVKQSQAGPSGRSIAVDSSGGGTPGAPAKGGNGSDGSAASGSGRADSGTGQAGASAAGSPVDGGPGAEAGSAGASAKKSDGTEDGQ